MNRDRNQLLRIAPLFATVILIATGSGAAPIGEHYSTCIGPGPGFQLVQVQPRSGEELARLLQLAEIERSIEVWTDHPKPGDFIEVKLPATSKFALEALGLPFTVTVHDLQAHYDELFRPRGDSFFDSFRTYEEHVAFMNSLASTYPELAEVISLGGSVQGRPLWALRITAGDSKKPAVMYHGSQHGNEIHGAVVVAHLARYLLEGYSTDPQIRRMVDGLDFFLLPIMNPDGYETGSRYNAHGVDLNRNWTGPGTSDLFTEPESMALRDFFLNHPHVRAHLDLHGYRQDIMWPWGHTSGQCPDHSTFKMLADRMYHVILENGGPEFRNRGPIYSTIYPVVGGSVDHTYDAFGIWAFVFELTGTGGPPVLEDWSEHLTRGLVYLSNWILDCSVAERGGPEDCNFNGTLDSCEVHTVAEDLNEECTTDIDGDGYHNLIDACLFRPTVGRPRPTGWPFSDLDGDCLVNLVDYRWIDDCLPNGGPGVVPFSRRCRSMDYDADGDYDLADLGAIFNQFE